jgi:3'-5' exoribonuclease
MGRAKPTIHKLYELQPGQSGDFFALLIEKTKGLTQTNKPFYTCRFRDAHRTATLMVWQDTDWFERCEKEWLPGMFFKIRATYGEHKNYGPQIDVANIRVIVDADKADGFNESDFIERSRFDSTEMFAELRGLVETSIIDEGLRQLTLLLLDRHQQAIKRLPATQRQYYPFPGGWLEHTLSVTKNCLWLVDRYQSHYANLQPKLNHDLVVTGAVLHEIGRVVELEWDSDLIQGTETTIPGKLLGYVILSRDLIRDAAREIGNVNPELMQLLEHIVLSHLSPIEGNSARLPLIPEALILHHADELDTQMEIFTRCISRQLADRPFTERDPILGRRLLKARTV